MTVLVPVVGEVSNFDYPPAAGLHSSRSSAPLVAWLSSVAPAVAAK